VVPRRELPVQRAGEDDGDYFRRVDHWRAEHGLPRRVFLSLLGALGVDELGDEDKEALEEDDRKPQYISFHDPFLVRLLGRLLARAPVRVLFEEVLPAAEDMARVDDVPTVTEWVMQWTA